LHRTFACVDTVPVTFWNDLIDEDLTDWLFVAGDEPFAGGG
jgi:hypothetical protein